MFRNIALLTHFLRQRFFYFQKILETSFLLKEWGFFWQCNFNEKNSIHDPLNYTIEKVREIKSFKACPLKGFRLSIFQKKKKSAKNKNDDTGKRKVAFPDFMTEIPWVRLKVTFLIERSACDSYLFNPCLLTNCLRENKATKMVE